MRQANWKLDRDSFRRLAGWEDENDADDGRMQHRPADRDGTPIHDMTHNFPSDIYTHPHYYSDMTEPSNQKAHDVINRVRGNPEANVHIYRSLPAEHAHQGFRPGDWVSTSKDYARQHGTHASDPKHDWPVIHTVVKAKDLHTDGDDFREFGYNGDERKPGNVAFKGGYHQEVRDHPDGGVVPVVHRGPTPTKGYTFRNSQQSWDGSAGSAGHITAYAPDESYAGHATYWHGKPDETHIDPDHQHLADELTERMHRMIPKFREASLQVEAVPAPQRAPGESIEHLRARHANWRLDQWALQMLAGADKIEHPYLQVLDHELEDLDDEGLSAQAVQVPPAGLSFTHDDMETGGSKHPIRTHLRAHTPEDGQVGALIYYPPRRRNGVVTIHNLHVEPDQRRRGIGSALMDEVQRRHPDSTLDHGDRTANGEDWWEGYTDGKTVRRGRTALLERVEKLGPIIPVAGVLEGSSTPYDATYQTPDDLHYLHRDPQGVYSRTKAGRLSGFLNWNSQGEVGSVQVHPDYRRHGLASALWEHAKMAEPNLHHSTTLSNDGAAWAEKTAGAEGANYANIRFQKEDGDSHNEYSLFAVHPDHGDVGYLRYSDGGDPAAQVQVHMMRVRPQHRRRGVGSALMDELQRRYPGASIDHGDRTANGDDWWAGYSDGKTVRRGRTAAVSQTHWHVSDSRNRDSIAEHGLDLAHSSDGQHIWLHGDEDEARQYQQMGATRDMHGTPVTKDLYRVDTTGYRTSKEPHGVADIGQRVVKRSIPPERIERIESSLVTRSLLVENVVYEHPRIDPEVLRRGSGVGSVERHVARGAREDPRPDQLLRHAASGECVSSAHFFPGMARDAAGSQQGATEPLSYDPHPQIASDLRLLPDRVQDAFHDRVDGLRSGERHPSTHPLKGKLQGGWHGTSIGGNQYRMIHRVRDGVLQVSAAGAHDDAYNNAIKRQKGTNSYFGSWIASVNSRWREGQRKRCPCGLMAEFDPLDGWQHLDGSISHEDGGESVSQRMSCTACSGTGEQGTGHECYQCDGTGLREYQNPSVDNANSENELLVGRDDGNGIKPVLAARFTPDQRVFTHTDGLDHRLFDQDGHLRPEVRSYIMGSIEQFWRGRYRDWAHWAKVYFAGSEASMWTSPTLEGNSDFDVLVGVEYDRFRAANPQYADLSDAEISAQMNHEFGAGLNNSETYITVDGVSTGPWSRTTYVNEDSYDIKRIKPYAAYDVGNDRWVVKPPDLPHWSVDDLPKPVVAELRAVEAYAKAVLKLPEPMRTQQGAALFEHLHSDRSRAFSDRGEGWIDPGNLAEKWLDMGGWWAELVDCAHRAKEGLDLAPADWSNTPPGYTASASSLQITHKSETNPDADPDDEYDKDWVLHTIVGHVNGQQVGKLEVDKHPSEARGVVSDIAIHPDHRRKGYATALLQHAREHLGFPIDHSERLTDDGKAWSDKVGHMVKLPKTETCKYCDQPATGRVIWAEGMAYIPVCDEHERRAIDHVGDDYCNTRPIPKTAVHHQAMPWHEQRGGESAEEVGAKSVRHAGFKGFVGPSYDDESYGETHHDGEFDEDAWDRAAPEPTSAEHAHYEQHDEYPDTYHERHEQAYGHEIDKKRQEDVPDHEDDHLHHFISEHGAEAPVWTKHSKQPVRVDLTKGVYATQSHVGQKHIDRYLADPHDQAWHLQSHPGADSDGYLGNGHPMFVTHEGRLHVTEGHHRVAAALQRGDSSIEGWHHDLDKHPIAENYHTHEPCEDCQYHASGDEEKRHFAWRHMGLRRDDLYGTGDVDKLFHGSPTTSAPFTPAGRSKRYHDYDKDLVAQAISHPEDHHMQDVDPRELRSTQPSVIRAGVSHYLTDKYDKTGETYADMHHPGNRRPIVYHREADDNKILLSGHHRAAAALLQGKPLQAIVVRGGYGEPRGGTS